MPVVVAELDKVWMPVVALLAVLQLEFDIQVVTVFVVAVVEIEVELVDHL